MSGLERVKELLEWIEDYATADPEIGEVASRAVEALAILNGASDGYATVPIEPTDEMIGAACLAWVKLHPAFKDEKPKPTAGDVVIAVYQAMVMKWKMSNEQSQ